MSYFSLNAMVKNFAIEGFLPFLYLSPQTYFVKVRELRFSLFTLRFSLAMFNDRVIVDFFSLNWMSFAPICVSSLFPCHGLAYNLWSILSVIWNSCRSISVSRCKRKGLEKWDLWFLSYKICWYCLFF